MNLSQFLDHWSIAENPFRGEEARQDSVFVRIGLASQGSESLDRGPQPAVPAAGISVSATQDSTPTDFGPRPTSHSDFDKILGDLARPSTSIVFGEKGSGKTAIRLQIADHVARYNARHPQARILLVPYDDLNAMLERYHRRIGGKSPSEAFQKFRLVDHIDAVLTGIIPRLIDRILERPAEARAARDPGLDLGPDARKVARRLDAAARRDLIVMQVVYDCPEAADARTTRVRRLLRLNLPTSFVVWSLLAWIGWIPAGALFYMAGLKLTTGNITVQTYVFAALLALWLLVLGKRFAWDNLALVGLARRVRRQIRIQNRSERSYIRSFRQLDPGLRDGNHLPLSDSDEARYATLERLKRILAVFGYSGLLIVVDRVDEPTLISGDPDRMRAVIWPLFNNKFLQQERVGVKLLLPIELRHALFKESSAFFQEARLDKQNLVERLSWTGAMLYDLCDARLRACLAPGAPPISLLDLFAEDVTAKDLVDALDQMHQPRDAFKFLYACLTEHCSAVTSEQNQWKVACLTLESVKKQQADRVQQLYRGIRPA